MLSVLNIIVTTVCAPLSDKLGRKTCILLSIAGMVRNLSIFERVSLFWFLAIRQSTPE